MTVQCPSVSWLIDLVSPNELFVMLLRMQEDRVMFYLYIFCVCGHKLTQACMGTSISVWVCARCL